MLIPFLRPTATLLCAFAFLAACGDSDTGKSVASPAAGGAAARKSSPTSLGRQPSPLTAKTPTYTQKVENEAL